MTEDTLPRRYARSLAKHGYGHALYEPVSNHELSPGSCGYINSEGAWNLFLSLDQKDVLQTHGMSLCGLERAPRSTREWGPKVSSNVKQSKIDIKGDVSLVPAGIPTDIGVLLQYETNHDEGTILLTSPPVMKDSLRHEEPFKRWVRDNARIIATVWPDVLQHGLFIVTSTHSTTEARLNILNSNTRTVSVGFNAGFVPIGEIAPSTTWHTSTADSGWIRVSADKIGDEKVVFFGGLYFRWPFGGVATGHTRLVGPEKWKNHFRSGDQDSMTITIPKLNDNHGDDTPNPLAESFDIVYSPIGTNENRLADEFGGMGQGQEQETDEF